MELVELEPTASIAKARLSVPALEDSLVTHMNHADLLLTPTSATPILAVPTPNVSPVKTQVETRLLCAIAQ